jgi:hypothetical protein
MMTALIAVPRLFRWASDVHPRNILRRLELWEVEYRDTNSPQLLSYVEDYYRYEDMAEYQGTELGKARADQRKRTLDAMRKGIGENQQARLEKRRNDWKREKTPASK